MLVNCHRLDLERVAVHVSADSSVIGLVTQTVQTIKERMFRLFPNESLFVCAGLSCYAWAFSSCSEWGLLFVVMHELLLLQSTGSRHMSFSSCRCGFSCSVACGIFPGQELNPCHLHWQANSHPLYNQGSPPNEIVLKEEFKLKNFRYCFFLFFSYA